MKTFTNNHVRLENKKAAGGHLPLRSPKEICCYGWGCMSVCILIVPGVGSFPLFSNRGGKVQNLDQ